jgi:hypothetical protein
MKQLKYVLNKFLLLPATAFLIFTSCYDSTTTTNTSDEFDLLIVVEKSLHSSIQTNLTTYVNAIAQKNHEARVIEFTGSTAGELRSTLKSYYEDSSIKGAFLIGNLPAAWYEKRTYNKYNEEFPFDIYLMDFDNIWIDSDNNGIFDDHKTIETEIYVSRLKGTASDINSYLEKVVDYKKGGSIVKKGAFIFKDDDWRNFSYNNMFGLNQTYEEIHLYQSLEETIRSKYINFLSKNGAEYVYQWIHSSPTTLYIDGTSGSERITLNDIQNYNLKGSFYNLFDCSAARFVQSNLAMTYLTKTDYGLATIGSTKIGGNWEPSVFHEDLAAGKTWGDAYKNWYNAKGIQRDDWYLGMVIFGDPTLTISDGSRKSLSRMKTHTQKSIQNDKELLLRDYSDTTGDFKKYKEENPQFFTK